MTFIFMMRHGQSDGNVRRVFSGRNLPSHLTSKGVSQVKAVVEEFRDVNIKALYSSPVTRALESAKILSDNLGVDVIVDESLTETDMGLLEGRNIDDLRKEKVDPINEFFNEALNEYGLEKFAHIQNRMMKSLGKIISQYRKGNVIVVTHMDPIRSVVSEVLNLDVKATSSLYAKNAALTVLCADEDGIRLLAYNVTKIQDYFGIP